MISYGLTTSGWVWSRDQSSGMMNFLNSINPKERVELLDHWIVGIQWMLWQLRSLMKIR